MTKKEIKERIHDFEYYSSGYQRLSGHDVLVKNLRITKTKAIADIIFIDYEDNQNERYNECEYPLAELLKLTQREEVKNDRSRRRKTTQQNACLNAK